MDKSEDLPIIFHLFSPGDGRWGILQDKWASWIIMDPGRFFMLIFWKYLAGLLGVAGIILSSAIDIQAAEPKDVPFYIYWSAEPLEHLPDGQVRQTLTLSQSRPEVTLTGVENYVRLTRLSNYRQGQGKEIELIRAQWLEKGATRQLSLMAGDYVRADVWAKASALGGTYYAQTSFILFSQAGGLKYQGQALSARPDWPEFELQSSGDFYWFQTGQQFTLKPVGFTPQAVTVWDYGQKVGGVTSESGCFAYQPKHDPRLNNLGATAVKGLVFTADYGTGAPDLARAGTASFTLLIHRSRTSGADLLSGLGLLGASLTLTALGVYLVRRRRVAA